MPFLSATGNIVAFSGMIVVNGYCVKSAVKEGSMGERRIGGFGRSSVVRLLPAPLSCVALTLGGTEIAAGQITYDDGATHSISNSLFSSIDVGPNSATTVNILPGGNINANAGGAGDAVDFQGGTINISGGSVTGGNVAQSTAVTDAIYIDNIGTGGTLNISGGTITAGTFSGPPGETNAIFVNNSAARINISGGVVTSGSTGSGNIDLNVGGTLTVTGGSITSGINALGDIFNRGTVTIDGGNITSTNSLADLFNQGGTISILGGNISADNGTGILNQEGTIDIYGSSFNYPFGPISASNGTLVGFLANGSVIDTSFSQSSSGSIVLSELPEPGSLTLLAAACGGLLFRRSVKIR
jgi:hypothetical protein